MTKQWIEFAHNIKQLYGKEFVPLHEPTFNEKEVEYVTDCIETGWVSSVGAYVTRFEEDLAKFVGVKRAVAVVNGTASLHIALKAVGVKAQDEVLMPSLTFIATANAVSYLQAVPHFVDVNEETLGVDPVKLEQYLVQIGEMRGGVLFNKQTNRRIKALVPMHTFGHPCMMDELVAICEKYHIVLVEDAAESLGSYYKGKHTGTFGKVSAMSFNGNKIMTTGGGGAILTDDEELANYMKHITTTAKVPHKWEFVHDEIGYNYRMPNINAALGCAQLEKLRIFIEQKRSLTNFYDELVATIDGVRLMKEPVHTSSNYWLQTIVLDETYKRDEVLQLLNDEGIMSRPIWTPMHELGMYKGCPRMDLMVTEKLKRKVINIPSTAIEVKL
ncbi:LegC family aminotransferase [Lysinibacillus capsici]|uniref:LegC family aminotransferase n=1 Tax=Lysinibacillus capsici TaxID=2115968 RepID=UPI00273224BD|nr:LegC family aminotransferase [Lysinibacillus capsici]MDP1393426.1 LegC family aminotransferase [Lysinibacillus capsici]MDP1413900.1 LegC family aminotransferase [Lysinibacillus capsici]MDP1429162.1 LegC family aminotransferase [Lysinibacillus capsici]